MPGNGIMHAWKKSAQEESQLQMFFLFEMPHSFEQKCTIPGLDLNGMCKSKDFWEVSRLSGGKRWLHCSCTDCCWLTLNIYNSLSLILLLSLHGVLGAGGGSQLWFLTATILFFWKSLIIKVFQAALKWLNNQDKFSQICGILCNAIRWLAEA